MISPLILHLSDATKTRFAGKSLAETLYNLPLTIFLTGDVGAGKTTFLQGFAEVLGIQEPVTSPTYALEQRYQTNLGAPLIHLDLYRLSNRDAAILVEETEDHNGIRCIEWAERLGISLCEDKKMNSSIFNFQFSIFNSIHIHLSEESTGRQLTIHFHDSPLPTEKQIDDWRAEAMLPPHITAHCEAVAHVAVSLAERLIEQGHIIRIDTLRAAARLHDLLRFVDFKGLPPPGITESVDEHRVWELWKKKYPSLRHEEACTAFLREQGYSVIADIVSTHGIHTPLPVFQTIEQKILFYADKRCIVDQVVSLEERFADFRARYQNGQKNTDQSAWFEYTRNVEKELFPNGVPDIKD